MLDINSIRADFAAYLVANAGTRYSMDAALMHVVERAYQQGINDAMSVPSMLRESLPNLYAGMAPGMRGPLAAGPTPSCAAGLLGPSHGSGQGGGPEDGDGTAVQEPEVVNQPTCEGAKP